jgi:hypothetical protein
VRLETDQDLIGSEVATGVAAGEQPIARACVLAYFQRETPDWLWQPKHTPSERDTDCPLMLLDVTSPQPGGQSEWLGVEQQ